MLGQLHTLGTVTVDPDGFVSAVQLGGGLRTGLRANNQVVALPTSGEALARFIALYGQKFSVMFQTLKLKAALDACGVTGTKIASATRTGLTIYAQQLDEGGTRKTGSNHDSWNVKNGYLYPTSITCDHQGDAQLEYDCLPRWDGTNNPLIIAKDVALPTAPADDQRFTIGPVTIGGIVFDQVRRIGVNFGIQAVLDGADSDIWDSFTYAQMVAPTITLGGVKKRWLDATTIPLQGLACTHANTSLILRKRADASTFVAQATAEHIKFTGSGLALVETIWDAAGNAPGEVSLQITLRYDGTNMPLVVNTASAY